MARQTVQQTARGIDPPGPQNRAKRAANRAACNGPGSVRKPPTRANPGKVCKRTLTCQTQKNPARGRDRLGLAGQINCQKLAIGNCAMLPGLSDCLKTPMSAMTDSNVQKMGGLPGSNKQTPNPPIVGGALSRPALMSDMPMSISENAPMSCPYCLPIGFFYHAPARFAFQCGPCKIENCQTTGTMRTKNIFSKHWGAGLLRYILAVCWRFVLIRQLIKIDPTAFSCICHVYPRAIGMTRRANWSATRARVPCARKPTMTDRLTRWHN